MGILCTVLWLLADEALASCPLGGALAGDALAGDALVGDALAGGERAGGLSSGRLASCGAWGSSLATLGAPALVEVVGLLLLLLQASVALSWNVLISAYALQAGGPRHAPTLVGVLDLVSFAVRVGTTFGLGAAVADDDYAPLLTQVCVCTAVGHAAMLLFTCIDEHYNAQVGDAQDDEHTEHEQHAANGHARAYARNGADPKETVGHDSLLASRKRAQSSGQKAPHGSLL